MKETFHSNQGNSLPRRYYHPNHIFIKLWCVQFHKIKLLDAKPQINSDPWLISHFNTTLSYIGRLSGQTINRNIRINWNHTLKGLNRYLQNTKKFTFSSIAHESFSKIGNILEHKPLQIQKDYNHFLYSLSNNIATKLQIDSKQISNKYINSGGSCNSLLDGEWVKG